MCCPPCVCMCVDLTPAGVCDLKWTITTCSFCFLHFFFLFFSFSCDGHWPNIDISFMFEASRLWIRRGKHTPLHGRYGSYFSFPLVCCQSAVSFLSLEVKRGIVVFLSNICFSFLLFFCSIRKIIKFGGFILKWKTQWVDQSLFITFIFTKK